MSKRILMVCYYYPPITDVGSKRSVAFSKYMRRFGWRPYVVSVKNPDKNYCIVGSESPLSGIPVAYTYSLFNLSALSGKVNGALSRIANFFGKKLRTNYFYQLFCIPDIFWGWIPLTFLKCIQLIRRYKLELIYVSCTPYTSAIIGILLKNVTRLPLVIDFRDMRGTEEAELKFEKFEVRLRRKIEKHFIRLVLENADLFVVTSKEILQIYKTLFPQYAIKMATVYNGFDEDFIEASKKLPKFKKFTIIYTGSFYFYALESMVFFEALQILKKTGLFDSTTFQFLYYGDENTMIQNIAAKFEVSDLVKAYSRTPYEKVLQQLRRSHLQLIRIVKPMISTKVFEGISLNIPFLATIPSGEVEQIINEYSPSSAVITEESAVRVAEAIAKARYSYTNGMIKPNRVAEFLSFYSRENQTRRLVAAIEGINGVAIRHMNTADVKVS